MRSKQLSLKLNVFLAVLAITSFLTTSTAAQTTRLLHVFNDTGIGGNGPWGGLVIDSSHNLFGTTAIGGVYGGGSVFELSPNTSGGYTFTVLHDFNPHTVDGYNPLSNLVIDSSGNLYGTAFKGGAHGDGAVFKLAPKAGGGYTESLIYNFTTGESDGNEPIGGLIFDSAGNLYGTTGAGGTSDKGAVYELSPAAGGTWTESILFNFNGTGGSDPRGSLIFDSTGNLYGTAAEGGSSSDGTVFELSLSGGVWSETVLLDFDSTDGSFPQSSLIFDSAGNLYGTAEDGGSNSDGVVFELTPSDGAWTETVLHNFNYNDGADGYSPQSSLNFDSSGNLYGTAAFGGSGPCSEGINYVGCGIIFELTPSGSGAWTETILHNFAGAPNDSREPVPGLISDAAGRLYGTTYGGGSYDFGTVFEITP